MIVPSARAVATFAVLMLGAAALSGCTGGSPPPPAPSVSTVPSATPSPSTTPGVVVDFPRKCASIIPDAAYTATFGDTPLNDPGVVDAEDADTVTPTPSPPGSPAGTVLANAVELHCVWRDPGADITYLEVTMAHTDRMLALGYLAELAGKNYSCTDTLGGRSCTLVKPNEQYPVDEGYTSFVRDNVYVSISEANFASPKLLSDLVAVLWK
ncbi:hypothetical protein F1C58_00950 [Glaciihabitans sp. INWT7]|uniref:hypothetical protein n=1 Tax=Glaciihabitans sp. INWT7 TaxID=2596912 RepID=UPI00162470B3|nr:hypothetical protein [Glaciihabitans sp. INWT7]QNE45630.1 hypothetical protein F1C58_00950 [Glaciihabitans sp. INWT7]